MKLNVEENLKNLAMYFCEALGYRSYKETNLPHNVFYNRKLGEVYLVLEVTSIRHMLANMEQKGLSFSLRDVLAGKVPIPEIAHQWYGDADEYEHWPPCILVALVSDDNRKTYTDKGNKKIFHAIKSRRGYGEVHERELNYFLYCYDRINRHFREIPQETVDKIEDFLRSRDREIYDRL